MATSTITKYVNSSGTTHLFLERRDSTSTIGRTYYGRNLDLAAAQTDATWQIYAQDSNPFYQQWANNTDAFDKQWSARSSYFGAPAFANGFSLQLSGNANQYGSVPFNASLDFAAAAAFSGFMWVKFTNMGAMTILQKTSGATGNNGYTWEVDGSQRLLFTHRGTSAGDSIQLRTPALTIANGAWHLIGWTKTASALASSTKIYYDGTSQALTTVQDALVGTTTTAAALVIGANVSGGTLYKGNIDEVAIWNQSLTAAEVTEIYHANAGVIDLEAGSGQIASALVSWWRMGDGEFTAYPTIPDDKATNDMTLQAGVTAGDVESETPP